MIEKETLMGSNANKSKDNLQPVVSIYVFK